MFPILVALSLWTSCRPTSEKNELAHDHEHGHQHEEHGEGHDHEHEGEDEEEDAIVIDPEKAEKLGIITEQISLKPFQESIKVTGEISAPPSARKAIVANTAGVISLNSSIVVGNPISQGQTVGTVNRQNIVGGDLGEALHVEYEAAKRELERMRPLHEEGIVSTKDFNAAKAAYEKARVALGNMGSSTGVTITAPSSGSIVSLEVSNGDYVDVGQTIGYIGNNSVLSLRADLPKKHATKASSIKNVYVVREGEYGDKSFYISEWNGHRSDNNAAINDKISGYIPIYFTFSNTGHIEGNAFVDAFLILDSNHDALSVPNSALIEQQGQWFVYVRLDEDCYEKRPVTLGGSNGEKVEILQGLKDGEEVVVEGVTYVKLAESAGAVPEGHSHTH